MPGPTLDPSEARARFGDLKHAKTQTFMAFEDKETGGIRRPEMLDGALKRLPAVSSAFGEDAGFVAGQDAIADRWETVSGRFACIMPQVTNPSFESRRRVARNDDDHPS